MLDVYPPETVCRTLGERVRQLRLARNIAQQELAAMAGVSLSTVRRLESGGQATLLTLVQVAQALGAVDGLQGLFVLPQRSIAELEAAVQAVQRQRARKQGQGA